MIDKGALQGAFFLQENSGYDGDMNILLSLVRSPRREYLLSLILTLALLGHYFFDVSSWMVLTAAIVGSLFPLYEASLALRDRRITIEAFNAFALVVSFATEEYTSAAFIALMLTFASWLDWKTETRATNAVEELLRLKPTTATRVVSDREETIEAESIRMGDILIVKNGDRIPADGVVIYGSASINEAPLTGESKPVEKGIGDLVYSSTISESGIVKLRATKVGADSTLERMARLIDEAGKNKSRAERLADRFAGYFLPIVLMAGALTYFITGNIAMTAALFLIVCADDIAVSIPLAVTAALGRSAKRGVIVKGGECLLALARVQTLAFDKTGTLTRGHFTLSRIALEPGVDEEKFWMLVGSAEKFSEHPVGRALYREALKRHSDLPDPGETIVYRGAGIAVHTGADRIAIGDDEIGEKEGFVIPVSVLDRYRKESSSVETTLMVFINRAFAGFVFIADTLRPEAPAALRSLKALGIEPVMLTGDQKDVAEAVGKHLGITEVKSALTPETKLKEIEALAKRGQLAMVGDGINDAPALVRADVGIAMGEGGIAVAVEAANVVILTDRLDRIPELIALSRKAVSVINIDIVIWVVTNIVGVILVFAGIATPAIAAAYNFLTDFLPLINSARLFRDNSTKPS